MNHKGPFIKELHLAPSCLHHSYESHESTGSKATSSAYPIRADGKIGLARFIDGVASLGLKVWASTHKGSHEGVLQLLQPLIETGDAL